MDRPKLPEGARMKRIRDLLQILQYEVVYGLAEGDVPESYVFTFYGPQSKSFPDAVMLGRFTVKPTHPPDYGGPTDEHD